jgi:hypothetical protein
MALQPDDLKKRLTPEIRENILRDNWHSHDARWFLKVSQELGFDVGNRLNQTTLRSMAKTDMRRVLEAMNWPKIESPDDVVTVFQIAQELYFPQPMFQVEPKVTGADSIKVNITRCRTFEEVKKAGIVGIYQCPCAIRFESWSEACRLSGRANILRSMMRGDPVCEVSLSLRFPNNMTDKN